jgi:hypothetical protein
MAIKLNPFTGKLDLVGGGEIVYSNPNPLYAGSERFGDTSEANGIGGIAYGYNAQAGSYSLAVGYNADAQALYNTVLGYNAVAQDDESIVIGYGANAHSTRSVIIGANASSYKPGTGSPFNAVAIGPDSRAFQYGLAFGPAAYADGQYSTAIGGGAKATGSESLAFGTNAQSAGASGLALGKSAFADGAYSTAVGASTKCNGFRGVALGATSNLIKDDQLVMGGFYPLTEIVMGRGAEYNDAALPDVTYTATSPKTGTDYSGAALIILGSGRTGAGTGGDVKIQTVEAGTTGSTTVKTGNDRIVATSEGEVILNTEDNATPDGTLWNSSSSMYVDETADSFVIKSKWSDSTIHTLTMPFAGSPSNFSYNYIEASEIIVIPQYQQMIVSEEITIDGVLEIDGELVVFDLKPLSRLIATASTESIDVDLYEMIRQTSSGITTSLSNVSIGSRITITNRSGADNTLNLTIQGTASPIIKDLESFSLIYNGVDYDFA